VIVIDNGDGYRNPEQRYAYGLASSDEGANGAQKHD